MGGMELSSHYDLSLVALSVVIAIMAAYVAIDFAGRVTASQGRARFLWLAGGAAAMGTGIWSMHFIGMLAFILPIPVTYYVPTMVLSLFAAIVASLVALFVVSGRGLGWQRLLSGGVLMGAAIVTMHYTGMAAMRLEAVMRYDPLLWTLSAAIAAGVSFVGLTLVYRLRGETASGWNWRKVAAAVVMGLAIPSMHYTGMAAAGFTPNAAAPLDLSYTVNITLLGGTVITIGTFFLLGMALALPKGSASRPYAALPAIMVVMIVLALSVGAVALHYVEDRLVDYAGDSLLVAAADIADKLDRTLAERYGDTLVLAKAFAFFAHDPARMTEYLNWMTHAYPVYQWMGVVDAQGRIVAATNPASVGLDRRDREWFRTVRDRGGIHVRDVQASEDSGGVLAVAFTAPITGPRGEFLGAVTTRVGLPVLEDIFDTTTRTLQTYWGTGATIEHQFLSRDGDLIVDSALRQEGKVNLKLLGLPSALLVGSDQPGHVEERHLRRNVPVVTGYAQARGYGEFQGFHWGVLVRMDRSDIVAPIHLVLWKLGAAGALMFVPLHGFLFWVFGRLRKEWAVAQEETTRAVEAEFKHHALLESTEEGIYGVDMEGRCTFINKAGARMFGYAPEEVLGRNMHQLMHHTRPDGSPYPVDECPLSRAFQTGRAYILDDEIAWRKDGISFPAAFTSSPLLNDATIKGAVITFIDITERKRAEGAMQKTNAELSQALQEVKVLRGLIPICMSCKKIRDDKGSWQQLESYIQKRSEAFFSHGVCPDCYKNLSDQYLGGSETNNH